VSCDVSNVMKARIRLATFVVALALSACGGGASGGLVPSAAPTALPTPTAQVVMVTMASDKRTVTAHVGDRIQIALGEQYAWRLDPPDGVVLTRQMPQTYLLVRGTQAIWIASAPGTSTITATGTLVCPSGAMCAQLAVLFSATVDVLP
jgi:hypothetical protein